MKSHTQNPASDRWLFATLATIASVGAVISSLGAPLVPTIATEHRVSLSAAQWVLTAAMVTAAATTPALGRWGSGRLRRPVMVGSLCVVLLGTLLAALAEQALGFGALIAGRALQGVGLALTPLVLAVARDVWSGPRLASRLSLLSIATVAGAGAGYPFTALLATYFGVSGAYAVSAGIVTLTLLLAWFFLPRDADGVPQAVDLPSVALVAVGLIGVLLAISQGEQWGFASAPVVGLGVGGVAFLAVWVRRSSGLARRGDQPLIDLRLARRPALLAPNAFTLALSVGMYTLLTLAVLLVRADGSAGWGLDLSVAVAGTVLVPYALVSVTGSRIALRLARRFGDHVLLPLGGTVFASSLVLLALAHEHLWQVLLAMAIGGLGSGLTFSSLPMLIVPHVPHSETGSALALNQLLRYVGFAVGSAASVTLLQVYGGHGPAYVGTALTMAGVCIAAAAGVRFSGR